ncbi:MAG: Mrp/NBP35 family ATP-binding protein [bacterium]
MSNPAAADTDATRIAAALEHIANRLLVFSGKGGVGKTTVAVNLALGLALEGRRVGLLDTDITGPNVAKMLGVEGARMGSSGERWAPVIAPGNLKVASMSFLLESSDAPVVWRGPLKMKAIAELLGNVDWGELDWLVIDAPPGTGDEPLSVAQLIPGAAAVVVTTPQDVALLDSRKSVAFARMLKLNLLGVVENMSGMVCPKCGEHIALFKRGGGARMAQEMNVPLLGTLPLEPAVVESGDSGTPFLAGQPDSPAAVEMRRIVSRIIESEAK